MSKRDEARQLLDSYVTKADIFRSSDNPPSYNNKFLDRTDTSHQFLLKEWEAGRKTTACNGFVNWYAIKLGIQGISAWFKLESSLNAIGKGHAWMKSEANGPKPQYGDILRHKKFHVDVALDFFDKGSIQGILGRAAAGQGTVGVCDILKRVDSGQPYDYNNLEGWLDIELFFKPPQVQVPQWLIGWWIVTWQSRTYYYYFSDKNEVKWTQITPISEQPPFAANDIGDFTIQFFDTITTQWRTTASQEELKIVPGTDNKKMQGKCNGTNITAVKIGQVPQWLIGWWKVTWRNQTYYYYFYNNCEVKWTQIVPSSAQPPFIANDTGDFMLQPFGIATRWRTTGSIEEFRSVFGANDKQMQGTCNGIPITAVKI